MAIASQTDIELADGEVERIIRDEEANRPYLVEVTGSNPVRVGHTKRYARDGNTLSGRQTHTVSNLRGEELYAAAFDGPTAIRVRVAAADVQSQPEREVTVVEGDIRIDDELDLSDRFGREIGKARLQNSDGVLIDPATDNTLGSELPRRIDTWNAGTLSVDVQEAETTGVDSFQFELSGGGAESLPSNTVPAGVAVVVQAEPTNTEGLRIGDPADPTISLAPSGTISYDVTNTNQIGVEGAEGDAVNVTYEVN